MSLRSKPLEMVDELKDCFALNAGGSARGGPRRFGYRDKMSLRSKPLEMVDELKDCFALNAGGSFIYVATLQTAYGFGAARKLSGA